MRFVRYSLVTLALGALFLLVLLIGSVNASPPDEAKLLRIKVLEDDRYLEKWELSRYAKDEDPRIRLAAVRALGRIGRPEVRVALERALGDSDKEVRAAAAFSLGQLGDKAVVDDLLRALDDPSYGVRRNVIEALGKAGDPKAAPALIDLLESQSADLRGEAVLALGRLEDPRATDPLIRVLGGDPDGDVRWRAAYALTDVERPQVVQALEAALTDGEPLVVMFAAKALSKLGRKADSVPLVPALETDDWRVRVNVLIALGSSGDEEALPVIVESLGSPIDHVRAAACIALGDLLDPRAAEPLRESLEDPSPDVRGQAALALARVSADEAMIALPDALEDPNHYARVKVYEAIGGVWRRQAVELLRPALRDPDPRIRAAVTSALASQKQKGVVEGLIARLKDTDWVVAALAAEALGKHASKQAILPLLEAYGAFSGEEEAEVRLAVVSALGEIGAKTRRFFFDEVLLDPDYRVRQEGQTVIREIWGEEVEVSPAVYGTGSRDGTDLAIGLGERRVRIATTRGAVVCVLYGDEAPQTVANFLRLAGEGFYDGLTFHRVVPNFVIQGGCPRGDGWGGPGYTIRCEVNEHRYGTGTLGMALAGKDTGGSQFFITHSPQPHLDGRYTVFGQVLEGQEIVDAILPGDEIVSIEEIP